MPTLRVENVSKRFGGLAALQDISLEAHPGRVTSIIGQNGAGKTTLINAIAQLPPPDSGRIFVGDQELTGSPPWRVVGRGVARTFQQLRIFPHLSVLENVLLGFQDTRGEAMWRLLVTPLHVRRQGYEQRARARDILRSLDLADLENMKAGSLSYGLQKLLSLARVLATEAPVIMLDEPTSGLGRDFIDRILKIVTDMRARQRTVILIEHDMDVVFEVSDWVIVLNQGRLLTQGRPAEIRVNQEVRSVYFGSRVD
jgi:ABC-type branched-subunit amino acid transport system ATPase component